MTRRLWSTASLVGVLSLASCAPQPRETVDLLLFGGAVVTVDDAFTVHDSIAVRDGRIVAVGSGLEDRFDATTSVDLAGRTVVPGFVDSHIHVDGEPARYVDLVEVSSIEEMKRRVAAKAVELGPGEWITGYGWSEDEMSEGRKPHRGDLDAVAPENPVVLTRAGAHSAVGNSLALEWAQIGPETPDPEGGQIEHDSTGAPTGIIRERHDLFLDLVPPATLEELEVSLRRNLQKLFAHGITSIVEANESLATYELWQTVYRGHEEELPRASIQLFWEGTQTMAASALRTGVGDDALRIGAIKLFVDGGFTGPSAFTKEPYRGEESYRGKLALTIEQLETILREAHAAGWQLGIHAIGDAAIELVVEKLGAELDRSPREDHRHYLNHFTMRPSDATMAEMARLGIHITQQPNFTYTLEGRYVDYLDGERLEHNNSLRSPMDHGIHVALSSDILPIGPILGLYAATTRKGRSGRVFGESEKLTIEEALRGYTIGSAFLRFAEESTGSLEPGKLADLVVLSENPLAMEPDDLLRLEVEETYLGGKLVYERSAE